MLLPSTVRELVSQEGAAWTYLLDLCEGSDEGLAYWIYWLGGEGTEGGGDDGCFDL